jgi:hypothetical protein
MIVNDRMIATETNVTTGQRSTCQQLWHFGTIHAVENVRTERPCACSDFDILHGLGGV